MPSTFVVNAIQVNIDFARARSLMDQKLAEQSAHWVANNSTLLEETGAASEEQALFDHYCRRHLECFGEPFSPDVMDNPFLPINLS